MKHKNKFIKNFLAGVCVIAVLGGAGLLIPVRGEWVDWAVSRLLSRYSGLEIRCANAKIIRWSVISFDRIITGRDSKNALFEAVEGEIRREPHSFLVISLKNIRLLQQILKDPALDSLPISKGLQGDFVVRELTVLWSGNSLSGTIHLSECVSDDFNLRGGLKWDNGKLTKAFFYFALPPERSKRIPGSILRRLIPLKNGWLGTRITYFSNKLTLSGRRGPLFQAKWQASSFGVSKG